MVAPVLVAQHVSADTKEPVQQDHGVHHAAPSAQSDVITIRLDKQSFHQMFVYATSLGILYLAVVDC